MYFINFPWIGNLKILKLLIINYRIFNIMCLKYVMKVVNTFKYIYYLYCHIGKIIKKCLKQKDEYFV